MNHMQELCEKKIVTALAGGTTFLDINRERDDHKHLLQRKGMNDPCRSANGGVKMAAAKSVSETIKHTSLKTVGRHVRWAPLAEPWSSSARRQYYGEE